MVSILFTIGRGLESPDVITKLLDIEFTPRKPQYDMASELPLVLHDCAYDTMKMTFTPSVLNRVYWDIESQWEAASLRTAMLKNHLEAMKSLPVERSQAVEEVQKRLKHKSREEVEKMVPKAVVDKNSTMEMLLFNDIWPLLPPSGKGLKHIPLMQRNTAFSVQEKMASTLRKRKAKEANAEGNP
ncbi:tRNA pseudouridine synthase [Thraustotheca clavata]|uniref:tRNA pseudouridine synthase n=1 Tax=Thraustotheca clavata TaxID=74557 RepID=A0A1V9YUU0_9STRA|nr:tRNA pseudouridine synthase [Thraustotheca clavata]